MPNQYSPFRFISENLKECSDCGEIKSHSDFSKDNKNKRNKYLAYYCKSCASKRARKWHNDNKHSASLKLKKRSSWLKHKYGLSLNEYTEKLKAQNNCCAICKVELPTSGHLTHLDHCHKTGNLRAFLCTNCNRGLGHFQDSVENLQAAINYLQTHSVSDINAEGGTSMLALIDG